MEIHQMWPGRLSRSHSIFDEARLLFPHQLQSSIELVDGVTRYAVLTKLIPAVTDSLREKVLPHIEITSLFYKFDRMTSSSCR